MNGRRPRRRLAPSEKYELYLAVLTGQATQREAAERYGVDRSTVVHVCRTAKQGALAALAASVPGRPGQSAEAPRGTPRRGRRGRRGWSGNRTASWGYDFTHFPRARRMAIAILDLGLPQVADPDTDARPQPPFPPLAAATPPSTSAANARPATWASKASNGASTAPAPAAPSARADCAGTAVGH